MFASGRPDLVVAVPAIAAVAADVAGAPPCVDPASVVVGPGVESRTNDERREQARAGLHTDFVSGRLAIPEILQGSKFAVQGALCPFGNRSR